MSILAVKPKIPIAQAINVTADTLEVKLSDGRSVLTPLNWYPRLLHATQQERENWRLMGRGEGIHWEDLDEDISVEGILAGRASAESQKSLQRWLAMRQTDHTGELVHRTG